MHRGGQQSHYSALLFVSAVVLSLSLHPSVLTDVTDGCEELLHQVFKCGHFLLCLIEINDAWLCYVKERGLVTTVSHVSSPAIASSDN